MAYQAQETFVAEIDGAPLYVQRGQVYANDHPVVKLDDGRDLLFRPLDIDAPPAVKARGRKSAPEGLDEQGFPLRQGSKAAG